MKAGRQLLGGWPASLCFRCVRCLSACHPHPAPPSPSPAGPPSFLGSGVPPWGGWCPSVAGSSLPRAHEARVLPGPHPSHLVAVELLSLSVGGRSHEGRDSVCSPLCQHLAQHLAQVLACQHLSNERTKKMNEET